MQELVELGHSYRIRKVLGRLECLKDEFGFEFPEEELKDLHAMANPGKPHIGNMMVRLGYAESKDKAIREYINKVHFRGEYVKPEEAIRNILAGGGVPVLAHPFYGDGDQLILGEEMEHRLTRLIGFGLQGLEGYYSGFTPRIRREALALADRYGLYVTAGSDYHGTNKMVTLGDTGLTEQDTAAEGLLRFLDRIGYTG